MGRPIRVLFCQHVSLPAVLFGVIISSMPVELLSQTPLPDPPAVLSEGFLRNLALINRKADELDRSGGGGSHLRNAVCARIGLDGPDCTRVLGAAVNVQAQLTVFDRQAQSIIDEVRRRHQQRPPGSVLPPPPPELAQLQAQRKSLIETAVATLRQQLPPSRWNALASYIGTRRTTLTPTSPNGGSGADLK